MFSSNDTSLAYSTYLGGSAAGPGASGLGFGTAVDSSGSAYVVGQTFATDFPTTPGAFQFNSGGGTSDGFVVKIGSPCACSLSRTSQLFPASGGCCTLKMTTAVGCGWTALADNSWIFLTSPDSGAGSATITFELRENMDEMYRIGTVTIAGQTFTVLQEGTGASGCSIAINPTYASYSWEGGSSSVNVVANAECIWTAVSKADWVTITSNGIGTGSSAVTYSVSANPGSSARKAKIMVGGQAYAIKQKGNPAKGGSDGGKP